MSPRALVLGGGGVGGIAWELGMLLGLRDGGVDLRDADVVVGTSAGATVAAQVLSDEGLEALVQRQLHGEAAAAEIPAGVSLGALRERVQAIMEAAPSANAARRALGAAALGADVVAPADRRAVIEGRLPDHAWPAGDLRLVAVDVGTGERVVLTRESGTELVDAVAASCAVPLLWPPVARGGSALMDGGAYAEHNVDVAADCDPIVVLAPLGELVRDSEAAQARAALETRVTLLEVEPDEASAAAIGADPFDVAVIPGAARAGVAQGRRVVGSVRAAWT